MRQVNNFGPRKKRILREAAFPAEKIGYTRAANVLSGLSLRIALAALAAASVTMISIPGREMNAVQQPMQHGH
jgi:hypothetical protein